MNNRGLISSRSDVVALLSGELLQLRIEKSLLFKTTYHWEPHYFLLTSIGILKFEGPSIVSTPDFVPLKHIEKAELVDDSSYGAPQGSRSLMILYTIPNINGQRFEMVLSSESPCTVIEWTEMLRRLRSLYEESKETVEPTMGK